MNSETINEQNWFSRLLELPINNQNTFVTVIDQEVSRIKVYLLPMLLKLIDDNKLNDHIRRFNKTNLIIEFKNGSCITFVTDENIYQIRGMRQDYLFAIGYRMPDQEMFTMMYLRTKEKVFIMS